MKRIIDRLPVFKRITSLEKENHRLENNLSLLTDAVVELLEFRSDQLEREEEHKRRLGTNIENLIDKIGDYIMKPEQVNIDLESDLNMDGN
jgi:hypothetical protein